MSDRSRSRPAAAATPEIDESLRSHLAYLKDLGWRDIYRPAGWASEAAGPAARPAAAAARQEPEKPAARADTEGRSRAEAPARPSRPSDGDTPGDAPAAPDEAVLPAVGDCSDLVALGALAEGCTACKLAERRNKVVFGSGPSRAELMVIGEGPGAQEDKQGLPFVGPAGELLTRILGAIGQERSHVYIANVVKCRPPRNRDPKPGEVAACIGYLRRQIEFVQPRVLVALGRVAAQAVLETGDPVGRMRGRWHSFQDTPLRVTYHPAALLRNESLKRPTWEDMKVVRQRLDELRAEHGAIGDGPAGSGS